MIVIETAETEPEEPGRSEAGRKADVEPLKWCSTCTPAALKSGTEPQHTQVHVKPEESYTRPRKKGEKIEEEPGEWMIPEEGRCVTEESEVALPDPISREPDWVDKDDTFEQYLTDMVVEEFVEDNI